jgi:hypothetical protein
MSTPSLDKAVLSLFYPVTRYNDTTLFLNIHEKQRGSAEGQLHNLTTTKKNNSFSTQEEPLGLFGLNAMMVGYNLRYATRSIEQE